jgi:hypothetical protein
VAHFEPGNLDGGNSFLAPRYWSLPFFFPRSLLSALGLFHNPQPSLLRFCTRKPQLRFGCPPLLQLLVIRPSLLKQHKRAPVHIFQMCDFP